ncbi:alpha/beta hydrolase [Hoyosella sp. YIM 151337]|uniref:alpha/beta hydrolase n=1 Tax=Hoyosella sp. YIM 151337 TaxID=2992742 RepID=UPI0022363581|nr:alpha/beta hydrolase [Hoyosella sp. YIM 151337]MCW4351706.1 alpha/beta hydrolase [Hoyosella sp. YIM 151337]
MVDPALRTIPAGLTDITAPRTIDGLSFIDPNDPAMPMYRVIANNRQPVALRDMMIQPVRTGYIGTDHPKPDPSLVPPTGAEAVPGVDVDEVYIPIEGGVARCQIYRPHAAPPEARLPVVVYYHGGGFTVGSSEDTDFIARRLAFDNDAVVVSANYRLAPEFPFPAGLDDAMGVYQWVTENAHRLGGDASRIVVGGDSAGSNFAAAIPLRARDENVRVPDAAILLGAFTDFHGERWESFQRMAPRGIVYDTAFFGFIRGAYLPDTPWSHPWASPIEGDLTGYPFTVIATGTHDPIVDSARAFAERVEAAGGRVDGYYPEGMPHGFYFFPGVHKEEAIAFERVRDALRPLLRQ